jgi:hypothetical protein
MHTCFASLGLGRSHLIICQAPNGAGPARSVRLADIRRCRDDCGIVLAQIDGAAQGLLNA